MQEFWDVVTRLVTSFDLLATSASMLAAILAAVFSVIVKVFSNKEERPASTDFKATNDLIKDSRLIDLTKEFDRNRMIARLSSSAANLLTFSQFIVGGLLASSFIQESLSSTTVGLLGLLVLLSSLINQRYRPDLHATQAKQRMFKAKKLIRSVEDDLFAIRNGMEGALTVLEVRAKASRGLSELEDIEIDGSMAIAAQTAATESSKI